MSFKIRKGTEDDIANITEIYNEQIINSSSLFYLEPIDIANRMKWFRSLGKYPCLVGELISKDTTRFVGYVSLGQFRDKPAYNQTAEISLYIHKDYRKHGYGKVFFDAIYKEAQSMGLHIMIAGITTENTGSMIAFQKWGFRPGAVLHQIGHKFDRYLDVAFLQMVVE